MHYEPIPEQTRDEILAAIASDDPDELLYAVLAAALYDPDPEWSAGICAQLAQHWHFNVRGNAILGFAHIARIHGRLNSDLIKPLIEAALSDSHAYVRGHAHDAADDIEHFLGWVVSR